MTEAVDKRREFFRELRDHPMVEEADFSRDGFRTVVLRLVEEP